MQIKSYEAAVKYLESFIGKVVFNIDPKSIKLHPPLDRMKMLLSLLGNPQEKFKSILVGGTSGKGSTAYLISHILTTAGYKTGLTISPHLQKINERIQINGKSISDEGFVKLLNLIIPAIEKMSFDFAQGKVGAPARHRLLPKASAGGPSYFEILIAMAFLYFAEQKVDIAVVEVGMGGEFDATNTLYPLIAVLTNVSLDHTNILGGSVQKIARTKAGIIKNRSSLRSLRQFKNFSNASIPAARYSSPRDTPRSAGSSEKFSHAKAPRELTQDLIVVTGVTQPSVIKIIEDRCKEVGAELYRIGKDFDFKIKKARLGRTIFNLIINSDSRKKLNGLELSFLGKYQVENASLAVKTVLELKKFGFNVSEENIKKALKTAFFPGRFEVIVCHPEFISGSRYIGKQKKMLKQVQHDKEKTVILDGAHNPTKMKAFLATFKKLYPKHKKIFIVGFKFDKDIPKMLQQITKVADKIIVTEFNRATDMAVSSSADALKIKNQILKIKYDAKVIVEKDSRKALGKALNILISPPSGEAGQYPNIPAIIVVTGSLYLVGEVRSML
ncbi:MAG: hypothetical protein A3D74_05005 [Candidatus Levybacteria bacterium RIFCSPHIGHO2_02_FULL_37_13]|nr:MAG: hypothetical protein A3D74_05005 [Candidatus Levybacteria bacterium RIFCSPHIGHO2_02_FULL_37_13]OGH40155.1 MAG: hypothetical protein A3B41_04880 [Candidatus Levybacteria bacterium RIFCSPLOWO2_01_FULL_37_26]